MKFGIMGAIPEEVDGIRILLTDVSSEEIGGRIYWRGYFHGAEVVLAFSRCGKVSSASTATILLDRFAVEAIFFIGVAGAAHPDLCLGDVVIANDLIQHDVDASALPMFERFEIPLLGKTRFSSPADWVEIARRETEQYLARDFGREFDATTLEEFRMHRPKAVVGLVASGDQFVSNPAIVAELREALPELLCLEMEGAAVAQICYEFDRPCLVVRVISDLADHSAVVDFQKFIGRISSRITSGLAARVLPALAENRLAAEA
jgi:adenosylhomocysteine nucleosidase